MTSRPTRWLAGSDLDYAGNTSEVRAEGSHPYLILTLYRIFIPPARGEKVSLVLSGPASPN